MKGTPNSPRLSVVVATRNDDHGGNPLQRTQAMVNALGRQHRRLGPDVELIVVEWNPPPDRPPLRDAMQWSAAPPTRVITVPAAVHGRYEHAAALPLFQMIAKNVGIRRARGDFVLATNIDILLSDELAAWLASGAIPARRMVRVDRLDVPAEGAAMSADEVLAWCRANVIRANERMGTRDLRTGGLHRVYKPTTWRDVLTSVGLRRPTTHTRLHTNACGDFTLLPRAGWEAIRGYAELAMYSMHLDSVACHAAHHAGFRELVLRPPLACYHLEHAPGSGFAPEHQRELDQRLAQSGVPQLEHRTFAQWALQMRTRRTAMRFNGDDWGLAQEALPEEEVVPR